MFTHRVVESLIDSFPVQLLVCASLLLLTRWHDLRGPRRLCLTRAPGL